MRIFVASLVVLTVLYFLGQRFQQLPVEWALAGDYQRGEEPPGTHWRDVWGDQVARFPGEV
jgi:hypothetical protein